MDFRKRLVWLFAFCSFASVVDAPNLIVEDWGASIGGYSCQVTLNHPKYQLQGTVAASGGCPALLQSVKSFAFTDDKRTDLILFSQPGLRGKFGDLQAQGNWSELSGQLGGQTIFLSFVAFREIEKKKQVATTCKPYVGTRNCAAQLDLHIPRIAAFQTEPILVLSNQQMFPFWGGSGIALNEWARKGQCYAAKRCQWDQRTQASWCEVVLSDGFRTGYLKQLDRRQVFVQRGC